MATSKAPFPKKLVAYPRRLTAAVGRATVEENPEEIKHCQLDRSWTTVAKQHIVDLNNYRLKKK